ncbi:hypothetical protein L195_g050445, partial [Trifolium pratense]
GVIDAEFGKEDHGSILYNCDREGLELLDARTDPKQIKPVVKEKKRVYGAKLNEV